MSGLSRCPAPLFRLGSVDGVIIQIPVLLGLFPIGQLMNRGVVGSGYDRRLGADDAVIVGPGPAADELRFGIFADLA
ncbi:hypothetical protein D3C87_2154070 [compost metagenome]